MPMKSIRKRVALALSLGLFATAGASVKADVRIESDATGTTVIRSGKAVLSRCPNKFVCG